MSNLEDFIKYVDMSDGFIPYEDYVAYLSIEAYSLDAGKQVSGRRLKEISSKYLKVLESHGYELTKYGFRQTYK